MIKMLSVSPQSER